LTPRRTVLIPEFHYSAGPGLAGFTATTTAVRVPLPLAASALAREVAIAAPPEAPTPPTPNIAWADQQSTAVASSAARLAVASSGVPASKPPARPVVWALVVLMGLCHLSIWRRSLNPVAVDLR
jgi:hypothetical protein